MSEEPTVGEAIFILVVAVLALVLLLSLPGWLFQIVFGR